MRWRACAVPAGVLKEPLGRKQREARVDACAAMVSGTRGTRVLAGRTSCEDTSRTHARPHSGQNAWVAATRGASVCVDGVCRACTCATAARAQIKALCCEYYACRSAVLGPLRLQQQQQRPELAGDVPGENFAADVQPCFSE